MAKSSLSNAVLRALAGFGGVPATLDEVMEVLDAPGTTRAEVSGCLTELWDGGDVVSELDSGKLSYRVAAAAPAASPVESAIVAAGETAPRAGARPTKPETLAGEIRRILADGERLTVAQVRARMGGKASPTRISAALLHLFGNGEAEREAESGRWVWWRSVPVAPAEVSRSAPRTDPAPEPAQSPPPTSQPAPARQADPLGLATRFDAVIEDVEALVVDAFDAGFPNHVLKHLTAAAFDLARAHRRLPLEGTRLA